MLHTLRILHRQGLLLKRLNLLHKSSSKLQNHTLQKLFFFFSYTFKEELVAGTPQQFYHKKSVVKHVCWKKEKKKKAPIYKRHTWCCCCCCVEKSHTWLYFPFHNCTRSFTKTLHVENKMTRKRKWAVSSIKLDVPRPSRRGFISRENMKHNDSHLLERISAKGLVPNKCSTCAHAALQVGCKNSGGTQRLENEMRNIQYI